MSPWRCQFLMGGLNVGCVISQLCKRSELWEKQKADNNKKGVVGSRGSGMPMSPNSKEMLPASAQSVRRMWRFFFTFAPVSLIFFLPFPLTNLVFTRTSVAVFLMRLQLSTSNRRVMRLQLPTSNRRVMRLQLPTSNRRCTTGFFNWPSFTQQQPAFFVRPSVAH